LQTTITAAGGLALFLLAMLMMTDGLKTFAGAGLRHMLARWTATPLRGVFAGIAVTALVQSSSAVTIATIGFVNAGMLTLRQALGVVFGTNVGTTMTGWLVSLVGFGWKIDNLALPLLTLGVVLRLTAGQHRWRGLGDALAGFGLFFLALSFLQDAFAGLAATQGAAIARGSDSILMALVIGFAVTLLTQSSSAALAIILSAAASGIVGLPAAAAAVIGANLGTTSTALLAVLKATPAAKRLAVGHIAFNGITGVIALLLLPVALAIVTQLADVLDLEGGAAPVLALFHTTFNVFGVLLMLPLAPWLAQRLERLFHTDDENLARPRHLDQTLAATPALAVSALDAELRRLGTAVGGLGRLALRSATPAEPAASLESIERQASAARELGAAIIRYAAQVQTEAMQAPVAAELSRKLRTARYYDEAARLLPQLTKLRTVVGRSTDPATREAVERVITAIVRVFEHANEFTGEAFEELYAAAKSELLGAMVQRRIEIEAGEEMLDALSSARRLVEQCIKGAALTAA
jgi:phosphate:Na+ symporter